MSSSQSRHVYTREQRAILEASFARQSHPNIEEKERLAQLLHCNIIQISNWFQNHRRRIKKMKRPDSSAMPTAERLAYAQPVYTYHQSDCPCVHHHDTSSYYYYPPSSSYIYPMPVYSQPSYDPYTAQ